ncbi:MAG: DUF4377 domain-containing protein [Tannerellaceae bacterium]|jgi:hypothetical protein|nr:DUF4377 domain-containing protein [Tannerellaceae bacterium]
MKVAPYMVISDVLLDEVPPGHPFLLVKENDDSTWSPFYGGIIENFDYVEGFEYYIKVRKMNIKNPPYCGSPYRYVLMEVINKFKSEK